MTVGENIQRIMKEKKVSQNALARAAQISQSGLSYIVKGISSPKENTLQAIAAALECSVSELLGEEKDLPPGFLPMARRAVPVLGNIACGSPIMADDYIEEWIDTPDGAVADFALRCKGDSMAPTFLDKDYVLLRKQSDVADGRIAAVMIGDGFGGYEATLKRVRHIPDGLILIADNGAVFPPLVLQGEAAADVKIVGAAVGYTRMI